MASKSSLARRGFWIACAALVLSSCQEQESIRHYRAPKDTPLKTAAPPRREQSKKSVLPFRYIAPDGWEVRPPVDKQGVHIPLVLRIHANGGEAEATAMPLPGDGGGVAFNVNRWRRQVGLGSLQEQQIRRDAHSLKMDGKEAVYVDLAGAGAGKRILGVIRSDGGETWFFKLMGPAELVGKEQSHFEAFVTSVRFDGEAGAAHE